MTNTLTHASEAMEFAAMLNLQTAAVLTPLSVGRVLYVAVLTTQMANFMRPIVSDELIRRENYFFLVGVSA